ncbi:MAG: cupin domain-containing protein [Candidatus Margulisiibacteriota bacterium]
MKPVSQLLKFKKNFRWCGIPVRKYKTEGEHFKNIIRQTLLGKDVPGQSFSIRYFEVQTGGYSSLEKHEHTHVVIIVRGQGRALLGESIINVKPCDYLYIAPDDWHQFQPRGKEPLGFLCIVDKERDKPLLPSEEDLIKIRKNEIVRRFVKP